jgi:phosphoglycerol transferase MdoB-like AlkP superfamily enzyme
MTSWKLQGIFKEFNVCIRGQLFRRPFLAMSQRNPPIASPYKDKPVSGLREILSPTEHHLPQFRIHNLAGDFLLWASMVMALGAFRGMMIWVFRTQMAESSEIGQIARCFLTGLRFDISIASYAVIPSLVLTILGFLRPFGGWHSRVRCTLAVVLVAASLLVFVLDVGYFQEYHDQFNHWIFGLIFDDRVAIARTIWRSYPIVWISLGLALATLGVVLLGKRGWFVISNQIPMPSFIHRKWFRWWTPTFLVGLLLLGLRASLGSRPIQMKDAAVTSDPFLNKLVMNPFAAFRYAVKDHQTLNHARGLSMVLPDGDVTGAARSWFPSADSHADLDVLALKTSGGSVTKPARHIFLIVLESYDSWGLHPDCAALHATDRLASLMNAGVAADAFVSAASGTMPSLATLITGLPDAGVHINYQASVKHGLPTDTARIFKRLGYEPRFFYGGYLSWQRLGDFCNEHGFEKVHGGGEMVDGLTGNEWGVDDEDLYRFVHDRMGEQPTFNMIMTTSYHPPYTVDLAAKGFPRDRIAGELKARGFSEDLIRILGHLWYSDKSVGDFVETMLSRFPDSLFGLTGDHWSRRSFSTQPILFGTRAVPCVFFGPEALRGLSHPPKIAGSHLDIVPTLVELTAPSGFAYHSFGRDMFDHSLPQVGYGNHAAITPEAIVDTRSDGAVEDMVGQPANDRVPAAELRQRYRQLHALSWWRVMKNKNL